jgi:hypothetical protein
MPAIHLSSWDLAVVLVLSLQGTVIAFVRQPGWKAIVLSLPFPFTLMSLASGRLIDASSIQGIALFFVFLLTVWFLHGRQRVRIIPAIALAVLGYCAIGSLIATTLPRTPATFWVSAVAVFGLGLVLRLTLPKRSEPGYRSALPVWIKLPIVAGIVLFLVIVRNTLQGFATVFPIMGTIGSYEGRFSLWTLLRQGPVIMVCMSVMMAVGYLVQGRLGLGGALAIGWLAYLALFLPYMWYSGRRQESAPRVREAVS